MKASVLIAQLGSHPATQLGLDLGQSSGREGWLLAALLLAARAPESEALDNLASLAKEGLLDPAALVARPEALLAVLERGPWKDAPALAARLRRCAEASLACGGVDSVEAAADGFESLGAGLVGLAPGLGPSTALRFLRPLRGVWPDAADTPSTPAALAAGLCLGWAHGESESLSLPADLDAPGADVEAALERLGKAACRSRASRRCPLADACPSRDG